MPIYEYRCTACHRKFEQIVLRGKALDDANCPKCGSSSVERLLSSFSLSGIRKKSEDSFDDEFDRPDAGFDDDFGGDDLGADEDFGHGEGDELEEDAPDQNFDDDLEEEELT